MSFLILNVVNSLCYHDYLNSNGDLVSTKDLALKRTASYFIVSYLLNSVTNLNIFSSKFRYDNDDDDKSRIARGKK